MKKIISVLLGFITLSFLLIPTVDAQDRKPSITRVSQNAVVANDYIAANEQVEISGTVNGDTYVAGGMVRIDGNLNQDLLAAGGNILVTGTIKQDVRVAGGNITFSGATIGGNITVLGGQILIDNSTKIGGSLVSAGRNIQILSPIAKGVNIAGGNIELGGEIGGDVMAAAGELSLLNNTNVRGDLTYFSESDANISEGASVSGSIQKQLPPRQDKEKVENAGKAVAAGLAGFLFFVKIADVIMLLLLGLLFIWLFPVYAQRLSNIVKNRFLLTLLFGFLFIILTPILSFLLMLTFIGIPLAILIMILYFAVLWFARVVGIYSLAQALLEKSNSKSKTKRSLTWIYVIGLLLYFVLSLIPLISFFVDIVVVLTGVGSLLVGKKEIYTEFRQKKLI